MVIVNGGVRKESSAERQLRAHSRSLIDLGLTSGQKKVITQLEAKLDRKKAELSLIKG